MYFWTKYGMPKLATIVVGIVAAFLGYDSILTSDILETWNEDLTTLCDQTDKCPASWKTLERIFLGFSILFLSLSILSLLAGLCVDTFASHVVYWDSVYQFLAGVSLLLSGELVLDTAIKLDKFYANTVYQNDTSFDLHEMREEMNYAGKVAAGSLEIFNGVLYIITAGIIAAKWKPPILPEVIDDVDVIVIDEFKLT